MEHGCVIEHMTHRSHRTRPQTGSHCTGPVMLGTQQHRQCLFLEIRDQTLGDPIFPMRIYTAVGYPLFFLIQALPPCVVHKNVHRRHGISSLPHFSLLHKAQRRSLPSKFPWMLSCFVSECIQAGCSGRQRWYQQSRFKICVHVHPLLSTNKGLPQSPDRYRLSFW